MEKVNSMQNQMGSFSIEENHKNKIEVLTIKKSIVTEMENAFNRVLRRLNTGKERNKY